jgi:hypothetical protein
MSYHDHMIGRVTIELWGDSVRFTRRDGLDQTPEETRVVPREVSIRIDGEVKGERLAWQKLEDANIFESHMDMVWEAIGRDAANKIARLIRKKRDESK